MSFQRLAKLESSQEIRLSSMMPKVEAPWQQHANQMRLAPKENHMCCLATLTPDAVQLFYG